MIQVEHLTKKYGSITAVDDLSFEIGEGQVYGFLGPNGAGKSTTMNIIAGCLSPTAGRVLVGGHDVLEEPEDAKRLMGYLPERSPLYLNETPFEYLRFVGEARGLSGNDLYDQIESVMEQVGIVQMADRLISALSKGYRQRVGIAQALMGDPEVIILDEPTVGLDPIQIIEIRDLIRHLGETRTVIFSSHILSEVQALCGQVLIIAHGKLVAFDAPENLERLLRQSGGVDLKVKARQEDVRGVLSALPQELVWDCDSAGDDVTELAIDVAGEDVQETCCKLFFAFAEKGLPVFEMVPRKATLEDVFIELTEAGVSEAGEAGLEDVLEAELAGAGASAVDASDCEGEGEEASAC